MEADGSVQLKAFLKPDVAAAVAAAAKAQDVAEGVGNGKIPDFRTGYGPGQWLLGGGRVCGGRGLEGGEGCCFVGVCKGGWGIISNGDQ
jgi:hypothetical protein